MSPAARVLIELFAAELAEEILSQDEPSRADAAIGCTVGHEEPRNQIAAPRAQDAVCA